MTESPSATDAFVDNFTVTADNPLLHGHVVYGRRLLPGVGYVDLVLQVLARHGLGTPDIELRNLTILAPLVAEEGGQVLVTVEGTPVAAGGWRIEVRGRRAQDVSDVVHARAAVQRCAGQLADGRLALPVTGAAETIPVERIYAWCVEHDLVHSGLMKVEGRVHRRSGDWLAELELPTVHQDSADAFVFHPALFESGLLGGGVATGLLHEGGDDGTGMYLPLAFESFRAVATLGSRCYVRVPAHSVHRDDELIRMRVEFYDRSGARVAEVGKFVAKRVPTSTALDVRESSPPPLSMKAVDGSGAPVAGHRTAIDSAAVHSDVEDIVREVVAARLDRPAAEIDGRRGYYELGLASVDLMALVSELEDRLSCQLSPTVVFEYTTIAALAAHLLEQHVPAGVAAAPSGPSSGVVNPSGGTALPGALRVHLDAVTAEVATLLDVSPADVEEDADLEECGLGWTELAKLADRLNQRYGPIVVPGLFREHRTVRAVAVHLDGHSTAVEPRTESESTAHLHPLLHRRMPEPGWETGVIAYESHFTGAEPFLTDHRVRGERVLPAAAQLEMARTAVAHAAATPEETAGHGDVDGLDWQVSLDDVVWLRPVRCDGTGLRVRVDVRPRAAGGYAYTVHTLADGEETLCSQGRASLTQPQDSARELPSLAELRSVCSDSVLPAARVYELYTQAGLDYGPAHRSLVEVGAGTDGEGRPQVLAELQLPAAAQPVGPCRLHPSTLDGALQATLGLWLASGSEDSGSVEASLPFAVGQVVAPAILPEHAYVWLRHQQGGEARSSDRLDVTVLDGDGRVCADLSGLSTRTLGPAQSGNGPAAATARVPGAVTHERTQGKRQAPARTDIAIIGLSGRYPEAADLDEFWGNLRSGRDCTRQAPAERWDGGTVPDTWRGGFLDGIDRFDPLFFNISLLEAEYLDPQERLFLQTAHHALEDAGYTGEGLGRSGDVGVFVGAMYQEYQLYGAQAQERGEPVALSGSASTIANRVSYFYGFRGPSLAVDTMCSSSLTAIHLACEAIGSGRCEAALAGGVNLTPHPNKYLMLAQRRFLSSDGHCRSFGEGGDGYVPGEGVGAVLLKPLERAVADGDHIHAVIKASALNHGGRSPGYSVPDPTAQAEVVAAALKAAEVDPRRLGYLEAHGTGTALGDPIEIEGLLKAFRAGGFPQECAIGSVKSNIGHAESAAGIAGLTKVLLQMRHGELVPSLHSATLNPHIDLGSTPLRVQQNREPWQRPVLQSGTAERMVPRLAGVSSFGAGGANAHLVVEEFLPDDEPVAGSGNDSGAAGAVPAKVAPVLLVLSARSEEQLVEQAQRLAARLVELTDADMPSVAWTLQTGRVALEERLAFTVTTQEDARERLTEFVSAPGRRGGGWVRGTASAPATQSATGEAERALREWKRGGTPDRLLALWAEGAEVRWETAYPDDAPVRRISLPGYPFARERCWLDLAVGGVPAAETAAEDQPRGTRTGEDGATTMLLRPTWEQRDVAQAGRQSFGEHHVLVVGPLEEAERDQLRAGLPDHVTCRFVTVADVSPDRWFPEAARELLALARGILEQGPRQAVLLQAVIASGAAAGEDDRLTCAAGLAGLLRTAALENPSLQGQFIECLDAPPAEIAARLLKEAASDCESEVRYRGGVRYIARLDEITTPRLAPTPWREDGVYLLTGGAGGLGIVTARSIAASVDHATVVLVGRSPLDDARSSSLSSLRDAGLTVDYRRADVSDRESIAGVLADATRTHGRLTGIVHAAGVVQDGFILRKSPDELARVLAPKVAGLVHLDELTKNEPLETFLCYSSASGAFGNPGQADYAAANAFMDAYAEHRNVLTAEGLRSGRTVSVNWPLWAEGGMGTEVRADEQLRDLGLAPLSTDHGVDALRCALAPEENGLAAGRLIVLSGRPETLRELVEDGIRSRPGGAGAAVDAPPVGAAGESASADAERTLIDRALARLRRQLAGVLKMTPDRLDPDVALERYGMDSVIAVSVVSQLEEDFGDLSRTLLFEVPTLRDLARYFATEHTSVVRALVGSSVPAAVSAATTTEPAGRRTGGGDQAGSGEEIAIVGLSGRYPQAEDLDAFWNNVRAGRDSVTHIPADRWERLYGTDPETAGADRMWGAFLDGIDRFDPLLFGISPREAAAMDPQQRLFLETVWQLLEGSGVTQEVVEQRYGRRVGVYVGAAYQMYQADGVDPGLAALTSAASYNLIANRVSYFFGLEGPSLAVDSMCTSSTMAVHLACADLLRGEAELAIAGGVNLTVTPDKFRALSEMELLGSHPGSRSFRAGDGYLPAEAVGAVLLKPLHAALRDGDTVHAVITGTASAHGGRATGFMTPSHRTQVNVMRRALERAGAEPGSVGYVEAAANGASLADEVEAAALREVFRGAEGPVAVGTVKSGLGHPEAASGIAQLTKVVLQLRHRELPPLVDTGRPNPNVDLEGTPLRLCEELSPWDADEGGRAAPRTALVNSVAAGGSHVSLVVQAPPVEDTAPDASATGPQLVLLSAHTPERLRTAVHRLCDALDDDAGISLADLAYTSQVGREAFRERLAVQAGSVRELREALRHHLADATQGSDPAVVVHRGNAEVGAGALTTLLTGARGEALLAGLVEDGDLEQLGELWVRGVAVPWRGLHSEPRRLLPVPATVVATGSHWLGRGAPPATDPPGGSQQHDATPVEDGTLPEAGQTVAAAWAELLGVDAEGLDTTSNFFSLGGNSLLATRLSNLLRQWTGADLPVQAVFDAPSLGHMAAEVGRRRPAGSQKSRGDDGGDIDVGMVLESIDLVERMSDEELRSLNHES